MTPQFVYSIHDLTTGVRDIQAPLDEAWLRQVLADTEVGPVDGKPGSLKVRLSMSGEEVVVIGHIHLALQAQCGRCLGPAPVDIDTDLSLLLVPVSKAPSVAGATGNRAARAAVPVAKEAPAKDARTKSNKKGPSRPAKAEADGDEDGYEFGASEADVDTYEGEEVVLDGLIREAILLELPIFPLCSEECPGIDASSAQLHEPEEQSPQLDPRLAPLLAFQKKQRS